MNRASKPRWWLVILFPILTALVIGLTVTRKQKIEYVPVEQVDSILITDTYEAIFDYIFQMRIDHPTIVMAQCIEESGNFHSELL